MMDMSSARKYSSERPSVGATSRGNQSPYRPNRQSPRIPPAQPTIRALAQERHSEDGLLPPPLPQVHHNRSSDSMSSQGSTSSRRLCAKCGQPMADKFVRAMGKKFHLDCFRCNVLPLTFSCSSDTTRFVKSLSPPSSFRSRILKRERSMRYVRRTTFDDSICCALRVEPR